MTVGRCCIHGARSEQVSCASWGSPQCEASPAARGVVGLVCNSPAKLSVGSLAGRSRDPGPG